RLCRVLGDVPDLQAFAGHERMTAGRGRLVPASRLRLAKHHQSRNGLPRGPGGFLGIARTGTCTDRRPTATVVCGIIVRADWRTYAQERRGCEEMGTDRDWERWGRQDPYFGVLSSEKFRLGNLSDQSIDDFFKSGRRSVERVLSTIHTNFDSAYRPRKA